MDAIMRLSSASASLTILVAESTSLHSSAAFLRYASMALMSGCICFVVILVETGCILPSSPGSALVSVSLTSYPTASLSRAVLTSAAPAILPSVIVLEKSGNLLT